MRSNNRTHSYFEQDAKTYIKEDYNTMYNNTINTYALLN